MTTSWVSAVACSASPLLDAKDVFDAMPIDDVPATRKLVAGTLIGSCATKYSLQRTAKGLPGVEHGPFSTVLR